MYSRKFNGINSLPPDYGGVGLRRTTSEASNIEENPDNQPTADRNQRESVPTIAAEKPKQRRSVDFGNVNDNYIPEGNYPLRPVYEEESGKKRNSRPVHGRAPSSEYFLNRQKRSFDKNFDRKFESKKDVPVSCTPEEKSTKGEKGKGLLSSIGSLSKRSFSLEDIVLAALILLLISEDCDNDMLIILGFLLLVGM